MRGLVINVRRGRKHTHKYQVIIRVDGVSTRAQASQLVGKRVVWVSPSGKRFTGKITAPHGTKGAVRARFARGVPGQMIGSVVEIEA